MSEQMINSIWIYNINHRDVIIGKLKNVSKDIKLNNIRPYIKSMSLNNVFISIKVGKYIEKIDKSAEDVCTIEDILIKEKGDYRIYIGTLNQQSNNNLNNHNSKNKVINNEQKNINNNNHLLNNTMYNKVNNQFKNQNKLSNNNPNQNYNIMNINMNIKYNNNNNMNNKQKIKKNIDVNMYETSYRNNKNNLYKNNNSIMNNSIGNLSNMMNMMNINNPIKTYNVSFKISQGIIYNIKVKYNKTVHSLLDSFLDKIFIISKNNNNNFMGMPGMINMPQITNMLPMPNISPMPIPNMPIEPMMFPINISFMNKMGGKKCTISAQFYYNGLNIEKNWFDKNTVEYYFKNDLNPIIFVNYNNNDYYITMIKFIFKDNHGNQTEIFDTGVMSTESVVEKYLYEYGLKNNDLLNNSDFENLLTQWCIQLLYNNKNIEYEHIIFYHYKTDIFNIDYTKIKNEIYIYVNDTNNIIKKYIFKDNHGDKVEIIFNKKNTIKELIIRYLKKIGHIELTEEERKDEIQFIYNQKYLGYDDNTILENYFKYDNNPIIQVNDLDGMLIIEPIEKYYITFKTSQGYKIIINFLIGIKIERLISTYLNYINHPELINNRNNIQFLYNGEILNENITARKCFKTETNPIILVLDTNNLLTNAAKYDESNEIISQPKINVIFKTTKGTTTTMVFNYGTTIDKMLKKYLLRIGHPELINTDKIYFSNNARQIKFGDQTVVKEFFRNAHIPTVVVNGLNDLIGH